MTRSTMPASQPTSPAGFNPYVLTLDLPSSSRNRNQSVYTGKALHRQGPSDSSRCLLPRKDDTPQSSPSSFAQSFADSFTESLSGYQQVLAQSSVYLNYQHSLNSLIDIIDRVRVRRLGPCTCTEPLSRMTAGLYSNFTVSCMVKMAALPRKRKRQ